MSEKQAKNSRKFSVKQVLGSIQWSIENGKLVLLSTLSDEYVTIDLSAITNKENGKTE